MMDDGTCEIVKLEKALVKESKLSECHNRPAAVAYAIDMQDNEVGRFLICQGHYDYAQYLQQVAMKNGASWRIELDEIDDPSE
jgi:hypothetical protein